MKIKEIQDLINFISESGLNEVNIETQDFKLSIKRDPKVKQIIESPGGLASGQFPASQPPSQQIQPSSQETSKETGELTEENYEEIRSPMIGTFYRSPNPESPPFVKVGDKVSKGQAVCIVEAMKLFNEIETEISGTIVKVLVDNSSPVEYDQPLFLVDPS